MDTLMNEAEALLRNPACLIHESRRQKLFGAMDAQRSFYLYWKGDFEGSLRHALMALKKLPENYSYFRSVAVIYAVALMP